MSEPRVDFSGTHIPPCLNIFYDLLSAPDQLLMTGGTGDQCGIGEAAYKVEILDESVVEYGGHPPDAPGGVDTFSGAGSEGAVCVAGGGSGEGLTGAGTVTSAVGSSTGAQPSPSSNSVATALASTPAAAIAASSVEAISPAAQLPAASTSAQVPALSTSARTWGSGRGGRRPPRSFQ
jgi:hypothetical protein